ncbi:MAG: DUF3048 C-terminal domain-containing protein [Anaerolineaceae bacterium]|nr:DUF3048 C-terminal domain-containing protein [Anaerolineaceae bacterium]
MKKYRFVLTLIISVLLLQSCRASQVQEGGGLSVTQQQNSATQANNMLPATPKSSPTLAAGITPNKTAPLPTTIPAGTEVAQLLETQNPPAGINPLTGLPVENPENLAIPPALVSIANYPPAVRPQAGLSYSPLVFELYIGEGMTRFLSLFYGSFPEEAVQSGSDIIPSAAAEIGPIRSGRLPYESLRKIYNGFLVMASAYSGVAKNLGKFTNIFGEDAEDVNSAMISASKLADIARSNQTRLGNAELTGMVFDQSASTGGAAAGRFWLMVSYLDQILWKFDPASGAYHRFQDNADGKTFIQAVDRLNDEPLTYENVIVLFVNHRYCKEHAFDLDLMYIDKQPALAFRDGRMYKIFWSTKNTEYELKTGKVRPIRFLDASGDPFPLKPGQTWVHIIPLNTPYWETEETMDLYRLLNNKESGTGNWAMRFYPNLMEYDVSVCEQIRSQ